MAAATASTEAAAATFDGIPVVDVGAWLDKDGATDPEVLAAECAKAAASLHKYGCLFARDPRVNSEDNDQ